MPLQSHRQDGRRRLPSATFRLDLRTFRHDDGQGADTESAESAARASASAAALLRWGAFSCAVTPVTLLACGVPFFTALGVAAGLVVVTTACGVLLRLSASAHPQRGAGRFASAGPGPHRGRHSRTGSGLHRGGRYWGTPGQP